MATDVEDTDYMRMVKNCLPVLQLIKFRKAAFQRDRPKGQMITEIVIHDTDSDTTEYERTVRYLANPGDGRKVSIHYIIGRRSGEILAMVPEERIANHANEHNLRSVGIELWRHKTMTEYTSWQYTAIAELVFDIMRRHSIPFKKVIGHGDFDGTRKGEPRGFDWAAFDDELHRVNERVKDFDPKFAVF
jgi:N-acetyl-anhydromuramyl-L-alanine amidase AmpD